MGAAEAVWTRRIAASRGADYDEFRDAGLDAFARNVEGTPGEHAFVEARWRLRGAERALERSEARHTVADRVVAEVQYYQTLRAFRRVVDGVVKGALGWPEGDRALRERRTAAIEALRTARRTEPRGLSVTAARPAADAVLDAARQLDHGGAARELAEAVGAYGFAERYARDLPATLGSVRTALTDGRTA